MGRSSLQIDVECYAGHRGEETPRRFVLDGRTIEVAEVVDRWLAPEHRYFKLRDTRGSIWILRHDTRLGRWELIMYEAATAAGYQRSG
ncbi:MAG: hypothetical protein JSU82_04435 [Rhodospirillales bacterium]|nr:MAG: hypothetical protein JSU82_04435 [Rhodospirillales bacterium]